MGGNKINERRKMKQIVFTVMIAMLFSGCVSTKPTADEQLAQAIQQMEETNSTAVIYQQEQSHGLFGDMIDNTFKTITGGNK